MANDTLKEIFAHLKQSTSEYGTAIIANSQELPIDNKFFYSDFKTSAGKIAFVDGGNAEILSAPNLSLQFIRVYASIFENNKRIAQDLQEFYVAVTCGKKNDKMVYCARTFDAKFEIKHEFDANDATLAPQNYNASPASVAQAVRKFAERQTASRIVEQLNKGDLVVCDGELIGRVTFENKYLDELFSAAKNKQVAVCGFSKTSTLLTNSGNAATAVLNLMNKNSQWYYLAPQNTEVKIAFVKLSQHAKYVFRADLFNAEAVNEIMSQLKDNSQDPAFLGYPYGLVDADLRGHISMQEQKMLKIHFLTKFGNAFKEHSASVDAHELLNMLH